MNEVGGRKVVLLDNYDSFTYNIKQYLEELGAGVVIFKNDEISLEELRELEFSHLVISPGPGHPDNEEDFGVCKGAVKWFADKKKILGICLGHQGIASIYGGKVVKAPEVMHGIRSMVKLIPFGDDDKNEGSGGNGLFTGIPSKFEVMRYHSLLVEKESFPEEFRITAVTTDKELIMAYEHKELDVYGVQFHPESIGTPFGKKMLENFLKM